MASNALEPGVSDLFYARTLNRYEAELVILIAGDRRFHIHKSLVEEIKFFKEFFAANTINEVIFWDDHPDVLTLMVDYCYTGVAAIPKTVEGEKASQQHKLLVGLCMIAERLDWPELHKVAMGRLTETLKQAGRDLNVKHLALINSYPSSIPVCQSFAKDYAMYLIKASMANPCDDENGTYLMKQSDKGSKNSQVAESASTTRKTLTEAFLSQPSGSFRNPTSTFQKPAKSIATFWSMGDCRGTKNSPFKGFSQIELGNRFKVTYQCVCFQQEHIKFSYEELRLADYALHGCGPPNIESSDFGITSPGTISSSLSPPTPSNTSPAGDSVKAAPTIPPTERKAEMGFNESGSSLSLGNLSAAVGAGFFGGSSLPLSTTSPFGSLLVPSGAGSTGLSSDSSIPSNTSFGVHTYGAISAPFGTGSKANVFGASSIRSNTSSGTMFGKINDITPESIFGKPFGGGLSSAAPTSTPTSSQPFGGTLTAKPQFGSIFTTTPALPTTAESIKENGAGTKSLGNGVAAAQNGSNSVVFTPVAKRKEAPGSKSAEDAPLKKVKEDDTSSADSDNIRKINIPCRRYRGPRTCGFGSRCKFTHYGPD